MKNIEISENVNKTICKTQKCDHTQKKNYLVKIFQADTLYRRQEKK